MTNMRYALAYLTHLTYLTYLNHLTYRVIIAKEVKIVKEVISCDILPVAMFIFWTKFIDPYCKAV